LLTNNHDREAATTTVTTSSSSFVSPACRPSFGDKKNISRIYFSHTRKAGGSTIAKFLENIATTKQWELVVNEAREQESPDRDDTLYIVNLRDPIERIISDYKYEGRWDCKQLVYNETEFLPSYENQKTIQDDIKDIQESPILSVDNWLWRCVEQCYTRWYGEQFNMIHSNEDSTLQDNQQLRHAMMATLERLKKYDIIVITEWLKDLDYVKGLEAMFGRIESASGVLGRKKHFFCFNESAQWNNRLPMGEINNSTLAKLREMNRYDTELYNEITSCGRKGVVFPAMV
jgi:hypothetical protein